MRETYHAAIQHDKVDVTDATLLGVVRRPTGWFRSTVDENHPELGPPEELLDAVKDRHEELTAQGRSDVPAQHAAWEAVDFEHRYREYLAESEPAQSRLDSLAERVEAGEELVLVCFESEEKRCHRHTLVDVLRSRVGE